MSDIDLQQFCSKDDTRPYICKPFSFGEFSYATNGHIIVRVARRADVEEGNPPMTASAVERVMSIDPTMIFKPLAPFVWPIDNLSENCGACDGRGTEHDCPNCVCKCGDCEGTGKELHQYEISVCGVLFNGLYLKKISSLPEFEIAATLKAQMPATFTFKGGAGAIMPLNGAPSKRYLGNIEDQREG